MKKMAGGWVIVLLVLILLLGWKSSLAQNLHSTTLTQISPTSCPASGCAPGQRLNYRAAFDLNSYNTDLSPNIQVCLYAPQTWSVQGTAFSPSGTISQADYLSGADYCETPPENYELTAAVQASLSVGLFGDALDISMRLGPNASGSGSFLVYVYEQTTTGWLRTGQSIATLQVASFATLVYVANDAAACGGFSPCYLNSADDLAGGIGTGLKDAVDVSSGLQQDFNIRIPGNYTLKSNTVDVNQPVTIQGINNSRVTYIGYSCANPMLSLSSSVVLKNLTIDDGICTAPSRDLIFINSPTSVTVESNTLTSGNNALHLLDSNGNSRIAFNHITNNSGYAILRDAGSSTGSFNAMANNLYANRSGVQVDCAGLGTVNHNFWGVNVSPATATNQCDATLGKQLGAAVLLNDSAPGVQAVEVPLSNTKSYAFSNRIAFQQLAGSLDSRLAIVNHGSGTSANVPFTGGDPDNLVACSPYWDTFLTTPADDSLAVNLFFRYDLTTGCEAIIESSTYCGGTDSSQYPLWWYDPQYNITDDWDTTAQNPAGSGANGATGQVTTCNLTNNEIQVALDSTGRPNLVDDLSAVPFVVGLPSVSSSVVITLFTATPNDAQVRIDWTTTSEVNTYGFYVQRSLISTSGFSRVSGLIASLGSSTSGSSYNYVDTGLTNGTTYYYRLEIVSINLESTISNVISAVPFVPTATLTLTPSLTVTPTRTITPTRTATPTRIPTRTPIRYATYYYLTPTRVPTRTLFATRTSEASLTPTASVTSDSGEIGTGYPVGTPDFLPTDGRSNYPYPENEYPTDGYPASGGASTPSLAIATSVTTLEPVNGAESATFYTKLVDLTRKYRPYLLGLLGLEIAAVIAASWYLYQRGLLHFPLISRKLNGVSENSLPVETSLDNTSDSEPPTGTDT
jgi:hypothetical protein